MKWVLLLLAVSAQATTYTMSTVSFSDCASTGCSPAIQDGDTFMVSNGRSTGSFFLNGTSTPGYLMATTNDSNIYYTAGSNASGVANITGTSVVGTSGGPFVIGMVGRSFISGGIGTTVATFTDATHITLTNSLGTHTGVSWSSDYGVCGGGGNSIIMFSVPVIDVSTPSSTGYEYGVNCMSSYGTSPGDETWAPAATGTCSGNGGALVGTCGWKSLAVMNFDGVGYMAIHRQDQGFPFHSYDSTIVKTTDGGATWLNPAHVGGSPNANGDAPAGPGDATYPASILFPLPTSHVAADQKMAWIEFFQYGQDGATWPNVDNNSTYIYGLGEFGDLTGWVLFRWTRANAANLSASDFSYYVCPGYATAVCDGSIGGNWTSTMSSATNLTIGPFSYPGLGNITYDSNLGVYILVGGYSPDGNMNYQTAPHPWGPWVRVSSPPPYAPWTGANLGFVNVVMSSLKTITAGAVTEFTVAATAYNHNGSGTPAYLTYRLTASGATVQTTNTQATFSFTTTNTTPCTIQVSTSNTYSPLVYDIDPALFSGSDQTSGVNGFQQFVVGKRLFGFVTGTPYSRALAANTLYYWRIFGTGCTVISSGTFTTANIMPGMTYNEAPPPDPANPGQYLLPSISQLLSWTRNGLPVNDPYTGAVLSPVSIDSDKPAGMSGSYGTTIYTGASARPTNPVLHNDGSGNMGYIVNLDNTAGGTNQFFLIPSTGEVRNLGIMDGTAGPGAYLDDDLYVYSTAGNGFRYPYTNTTFTPVTSGGYGTLGSPVTYNAQTTESLMHAFDSTFDVTHFSCPAVYGAAGVYVPFACRVAGANDQNSYGWMGTFYTGDGRAVPPAGTCGGDPLCPRVVAAWNTYYYQASKFCAIHEYQAVPNNTVVGVNFHALDNFSNTGVGTAPIATTTVGAALAGANTITVAGAPASLAMGGDPYAVPTVTAGDLFRINPDASGTVYTVVSVVGSLWTFTPVLGANISNGSYLYMNCNDPPSTNDGVWAVDYWSYLQTTDGTNPTYNVPDLKFPGGGHWDCCGGPGTPGGRASETGGGDGFYTTGSGTFMASLNKDPVEIDSTATFNGVYFPGYGNITTKHPSNQVINNPSPAWFMDRPSFSGDPGAAGNYYGGYPNALSLVSTGSGGILYKYIQSAGFPNLFRKQLYTQASSGPTVLADISSPTSTIGNTSAYNYQYCVVYIAGECVGGSAAGDIYFNLPAAPSQTYCVGGDAPHPATTDICIGGMSAYSGGAMQLVVGTDSPTSQKLSRNLTGGLVGIKEQFNYPLLKASAQGEYALLTIGWNTNNNPSGGLITTWKVKVPPSTTGDGVDRTTFVSKTVSAAWPGGSVTNVIVEFGYLDPLTGLFTSLQCTTRKETCVAGTSTTPFAFPSDGSGHVESGLTGTACTSGTCSVTIPVLPLHVAYYQFKFRDASNATVSTGPLLVTGDYPTLSPPPITSGLGLQRGGKYAQGGGIR